MKRMFTMAVPLLAAAMLVAGSATAAQRPTCQQIQAALASGKKVSAVAKELKVSTRRVEHCRSASMSASASSGAGAKKH